MPDKDRLFAVLQPAWPAEVAPTLNQSNRGTGAPGYSDQEIFSQGAGNLVPQPVPIQDGREMQKAQNGIGIGQQGDPAYTLDTTGAQAIAQPVAIQGNLIGRDEGGPQGIGASGDGAMYTLTKADVHGVAQPVPYDLFQITAPVNRQNRKPGDPCHTLARDNAAHAAVAFTPGNLARGAGPSPNAEVAPTQRCSAGRGADDQRTCVAMVGTDLYNGAITGDVAATMGTPGSSVNASGPTVMAFKPGQSAEARSLGANVDVACTLEAGGGGNNKQAVAFAQNQVGEIRTSNVSGTINTNSNASGRNTPMAAVACPTLTAHNDPSRSPQSSEVTQQVAAVHAASMTVRRLTPRECERLQAFPDDYTLIPWRKKPAAECPDGPRYKALGNSMACNCMAWIGERIAAVEARHD